MRSKFKWIFTLLVAFTMQFSFAQQKTVTGVVSDALGPLAGANVVVKGTTNGTTTDFDGNYTIQAKQGDVLEISYTGMKNATVTVGASNVVNVTMKEDILTGGEVIVEGYRSVTKATSVSSVVTVTAKELQNRPNVSFLNTLQGQAPGLLIGTSSGQPGSAKIDVIIRGVSSLNATTEPLYVIDGMPTNATQFRSLNPNDIESVTVLKDASAVSQYGNRGANGVIMINTKRGSYESAFSVSYNAMTGVSYLPEDNYKMANSRELLTLQNRRGSGMGAGMTPEQIAAYDIDTDWKDEFFRTGVLQNHDLAIRTGSKNMSNYTSIGYQQQDGIVPTTDFKRFTLRSNFSGKSNNEKFTYGSQIFAAYSRRNQLNEETNTGITANVIQNPLHGAMLGLPTIAPGIYATGQDLLDGIGTNFNDGRNIHVLEDGLKSGYYPSYFEESKFMLNLQAAYKLTKDLTFNSRTGFDYVQANSVFARAPQSYLALVVAATSGAQFGGLEDQADSRDFTANQITSLNFNKNFGKHTVDFGVYTEYMKAHRRTKNFRVNGLNEQQYSPGSGTGWIPFNPATPNLYQRQAGASESNAGSFSYFAIGDYDFDGKYGFSASIRRDASYRFVDDNKWGTFWSLGARWNVDREAFMDGSVFNMLKLRGSYGIQGNQNVVGVGFGGNPIFTAATVVRDLNTTATGYGNLPAYGVSSIGNTNLKWEEIRQMNVGLDFGVWKNKLEGNIDVYQKDNTNTTLYIPSPISSIVGGGTTANLNAGNLRNRGVELLLKYRMFDTQDFKLSVFGNVAYNKNEIVDLAGQESINNGADQIHQVGEMAYQWYMVPYLGVNGANGNMLFLDANGNPTETPGEADRRLTGKNQLPTYSGGFGFNADYKGFFMDANFVFFTDVWRFDNNYYWYSDPNTIANYNVTSDLLNAWSPDNQDSSYPSLTANNLGLDAEFSDRFLKDASYLRLRNLTVGYSFKKEMLQNLKISNLRVFMQAENALTWTKWRGFDPDGFNATTLGGFPTPRAYSLGVNLEF